VPAFTSVMPEHLAAYKAAGFTTVCIGYEAIVMLKDFSLEGSEHKSIRNAVTRIEHLGYRAEVYQPPLDNDLIHALHRVSDNWLAAQSGGEMHFSVGWFDEDYIRESAVVVVYAQDGTPTAFANLVTEYQKNELTLDLMRHLQKVENGTMEFLFARMLQWAKEKGYDSFSLGLSAMVGVGEKPDDPPAERALHTISEYISRFYNYKGLHIFKEKFHPNWEPRYMAYLGTSICRLCWTRWRGSIPAIISCGNIWGVNKGIPTGER
jgi:phosphatidylglycerol lysyltransferase